MKVLVTGGAGYIGAHFVNYLRKIDGFQFLVVDNFTQGRNNVIKDDKILYFNVDIRDKKALRSIFECKPDVVVHFAALANVQNAIKSPFEYYDNNIVGGLNVLECMREVGCDKIVFSSTAAVYAESEQILNEEAVKVPSTAYGYTKLVFEQILKDYHKSYGMNSISFRYFCATGCDEGLEIGCYHTPETQVIPNICKTLLGQQEVFNVWGTDFATPDGTGIRDYIHVNDLAVAHARAIEKLFGKPICEVYNLGINKGYSVMELIKAAEKVTKKKLNYELKPRRQGDPACLVADASKARKELDWQPKYTDIGQIIKTDYEFFKTI